MLNLELLRRELQDQVKRLEARILELESENIKLKAENIRLKEKLGLNTNNSSIPSSKELYKIKKNSKKKSGRKAGGQIGHKGHKIAKYDADEIIKVNLESTKCECGWEISVSKKPYIHKQVDIPVIKPYVKEYHLARGRCGSCGKRSSSQLPAGVSKDLYGPVIKTIISSLTGFYKNSKREVLNILRDMFNLPISLGSISNNEHRVSTKCKSEYELLESALSYSKILHIDETSHYNKGKLGWCWLFSNKLTSMIKLCESRGKKVLEESVFGVDDNIIISDRYGSYNYFAEANRQVCWSHLSRDFERFANSHYTEVKNLGINLKQISNELFSLKKSLEKKEIDILLFLRRGRKLRKRNWYYLRNISYLSGAPHAVRVAKNIMKSEKMMWKFLEDPENIPLTNNHAERQIRHYVLYRKNSFFTQSERGNRFLERLISLYLTWKQQDLNPFYNLKMLITH